MNSQLISADLAEALTDLDLWLQKNQMKVTLTVVGAFALQLMGFYRPTSDIDTITLMTDEDFLNQIRIIAKDRGLKINWINDGPSTLPMPDGFEERLETTDFSKNIKLKVISRMDMICLKAGAYVDRGIRDPKDLDDLRRLKPSSEEMELAIQFIQGSIYSERNYLNELLLDLKNSVA